MGRTWGVAETAPTLLARVNTVPEELVTVAGAVKVNPVGRALKVTEIIAFGTHAFAKPSVTLTSKLLSKARLPVGLTELTEIVVLVWLGATPVRVSTALIAEPIALITRNVVWPATKQVPSGGNVGIQEGQSRICCHVDPNTTKADCAAR